MSQKAKVNSIPTHACPRCGEWFDVERQGPDQWGVTPHDNEKENAVQEWAEAATQPLCPFDAEALHEFIIVD